MFCDTASRLFWLLIAYFAAQWNKVIIKYNGLLLLCGQMDDQVRPNISGPKTSSGRLPKALLMAYISYALI